MRVYSFSDGVFDVDIRLHKVHPNISQIYEHIVSQLLFLCSLQTAHTDFSSIFFIYSLLNTCSNWLFVIGLKTLFC